MKTNGSALKNISFDNIAELEFHGDNHVSTSTETPMRDDAFDINDEEKIARIENNFREIMETMGLDLTDDSLKGTPHRVAKMFIKEKFQGLDPKNKPVMRAFENKYQYNQMIVEKNITVNSSCEHHFVPIMGKAHVAYISSGKVVGLSKLNRIVDYYARRPQVQERLTRQIAEELRSSLHTDDVAVVMEAKHLCVSSRGIQDESSTTITAEYLGAFKTESKKREFLDYLKMDLEK
ncbi:MAG TPA: GTP cyclohydrolase I FolE [Bacteroidales bacterium]|nr:GTP cyclohydrolase I FolE [Bacteroidales bacterium]